MATPSRRPHGRPPIPVPLPLRRKGSYAKGVTVCIAAACQEDGEPRIVLCSDTRLDEGEWGATDMTPKFDIIGRGWAAQWAERPDSSKELIQRIKEWFRAVERFQTVHSVLMALNRAVGEFRDSPLCTPGCCHLIVTGFVGGKPVIAVIQDNEKRRLSVRLAESFAVIGSGSTIATVILNCRQYHWSNFAENAVYMVYEAKRWSEQSSGVGPYTVVLIHSPGAEDSPDRAMVEIVSEVGNNMLEAIFQAVGLRPRLNIKPFPKGFLTSSEEIQRRLSTTADPLRQQPSPESPAKSDES